MNAWIHTVAITQVPVWKYIILTASFGVGLNILRYGYRNIFQNNKANHKNESVEQEIEENDVEEEDEDEISGEIRNNYGIIDAPFKMMLCVNMELKMDKGKIAAQCGHATLGAYKMAKRYCNSACRIWERIGQAKVAVKVDNLELLLKLSEKARQKGLVYYIVEDAGRTQIAAGSQTVLAIGPAPVQVLEEITGQLKLL